MVVGSRDVEFVTVVYKPEVLLLALQAISMRKFLDRTGIVRINIVINDDDFEQTNKLIEDIVIPELGDLSCKTTIWNGLDLYRAPIQANGWRRQQTQKLLMARKVTTPNYIVLDAKNHFTRPASVSNFVYDDGRLWSERRRANSTAGGFFSNTLKFMRLDPDIYKNNAMPTITPFVLKSEIVRNLINYVEARCNSTFEEAFHRPGRHIAEFFLYYAYLLRYHSPIDSLYKFSRPQCVSLFTSGKASPQAFTNAVNRLKSPAIIMFGLHRNRIKTLPDAAATQILRAWVAHGLFSDIHEARGFMAWLTVSVNVD